MRQTTRFYKTKILKRTEFIQRNNQRMKKQQRKYLDSKTFT